MHVPWPYLDWMAKTMPTMVNRAAAKAMTKAIATAS